MNVPFIDLKLQNQKLRNEILPVWEEIFNAGCFIGGEYVLKFEEDFAKACSTKYCVSVSSGTDALRLAFLTLGLKNGDEVITVANTFIATTEAITQAGGKIVFVDINPYTYNIDPEKIKAKITPKTKGIVPVHLYGQMADMDTIIDIADKNGLWVVEDACQAHLAEYKGRKAGSIGRIGAFSFYPGKNLGACGEAGAVTTNDPDIALKIRMLRDHGQQKKYFHNQEGYNGRCDALQAAALRIKLKYLPHWNDSRKKNAQLYFDLLNNIPGIILPETTDNYSHIYHLFVIQVDNPQLIADYLKQKGISTGRHYPIPLHLQKAYAHLNLTEGSLPVTENHSKYLLSLPLYPELSEKEIYYVCDCLKSFLNKNTNDT